MEVKKLGEFNLWYFTLYLAISLQQGYQARVIKALLGWASLLAIRAYRTHFWYICVSYMMGTTGLSQQNVLTLRLHPQDTGVLFGYGKTIL